METYFISFVFVSVVLGFGYAAMRAISQQVGDNNKKKTVYFIIFFAVCAFFYSFWEDNQNKYNENIQNYLAKIEQSNEKIYGDLEETYLLNSVEDELNNIYGYVQEIYSIMNE